jgi:hypothetical protein
MESNTHSSPGGRSDGRPDPLAVLTADMDELDAQDLAGLSDAALTQQLLQLRRLVDRLEGQWLKGLAEVDARGAAGLSKGSRWARSSAGCATDSTSAPGPRPASCAPPEPCFVVR